MHFTEEEYKYFDWEKWDGVIFDDCPEDVRKSLEEKFDVMDRWDNHQVRWSVVSDLRYQVKENNKVLTQDEKDYIDRCFKDNENHKSIPPISDEDREFIRKYDERLYKELR